MTNFRFFKWCREAVSRIVLPRDRVAVELELMGHMEDRYESLIRAGHSEEDAQMLTLEAMGDPTEVARELGLIHRPFWGRTAKVTKYVVIGFLCLTLFSAGASCLKNFYFRPAFSTPVYEYYNPYSGEEANFRTGWAYCQFQLTPGVSFSSDGYTVTVTNAALWRNELYGTPGTPEESYPLYLQLTVTNPRIWAEADTVSRWIRAEDSSGNQYAAPNESAPGTNRIQVKSYRTNPWTSVHELVIWDLSDPDATWIDLHYDRAGRDLTVRVDLTGGNAA